MMLKLFVNDEANKKANEQTNKKHFILNNSNKSSDNEFNFNDDHRNIAIKKSFVYDHKRAVNSIETFLKFEYEHEINYDETFWLFFKKWTKKFEIVKKLFNAKIIKFENFSITLNFKYKWWQI